MGDETRAEIDGYRASGKFNARKITLADLIERHTEEVYPLERTGPRSSASSRSEREIGMLPAGMLTAADLTLYYGKRVTERAGL